MESLSPLFTVKPDNFIEHIDEWFLFSDVKMPGINEEEIELTLAPLALKAGLELPVADNRGWDPNFIPED